MNRTLSKSVIALWAITGIVAVRATENDVARGAEAFRQCAACHSLRPGRHLSGPSLAGVVGRKAGTAEGFHRYTSALRHSGLTWDRATLDRWLTDPQALVPETAMGNQGVKDPDTRTALIAFLEASATQSGGRDMGGHMMGGRMPDLKALTPQRAVTRIRHCGDAYYVTLGTGNTYTFWEFNLRFKTDSSEDGPKVGAPAILQVGMMGDRAQIVFAAPSEISEFIESRCEE